MTYLQRIQHELGQGRLLKPIIVASTVCRPVTEHIRRILPQAEVAQDQTARLMGRDVILVHAGERGWDEALGTVCQQCPGRLIVIAPQLPRAEALKLEWVADTVLVGEETFEYEVHELGLSA